MPEPVPLTEAAAMPEAFFTAFDALVAPGPARRRRAGAGACGGERRGHRGGADRPCRGRHRSSGPAGTRASSSARRRWCPSLRSPWPATAPRFAERVLELTGGAGVDLVLDLVGGRYTAESLACLAPRGRMMLVGTVDGVRSELDLRLALGKRARITGTVLRARPLEEKMALARAVERHVLPLFARGTYRPVVDRVLPVDQVAEAFEHLVADRNVGKIVLAWSGR